MRTAFVPKNVIVNGRRTSMRLEHSMWEALSDISAREQLSRDELVSQIERRFVESEMPCLNLTSAVRTFVANYYRAAATEEGHRLAGHGCGAPVDSVSFEVPKFDENARGQVGDLPVEGIALIA